MRVDLQEFWMCSPSVYDYMKFFSFNNQCSVHKHCQMLLYLFDFLVLFLTELVIKIKLKKNFWIERILTSDGEFYMSFDDYLKYFGDIEIVHLNPIRKNIFHPPKNFSFKIEWWSWNWENICFTFYLGCITMRKDLWANLQSKDL